MLVLSAFVWVSVACIAAQTPPATTQPSASSAQGPAPSSVASAPAPEQPETAEAAAAARPGPDEDPDKETFVAVCESCHGTMLVTLSGRRSQREWAQLVDDMVARGAPATDADAKVVADYLFRHYGRVNVNKATQDVLALVLDLNATQAKALCDYRTANGEFKSIADLEKTGALDAQAIQDRKDRIAFSGD
jgi:cytochrome c5